LVLVILGLAGLVFPVVPGMLLLLAGALVLSPDLPLLGRIINWIEKRNPEFGAKLKQARAWLREKREDPPGPPEKPVPKS
jgi:hypothetical protein